MKQNLPPTLSREQVRRVDALAVEKLGIPSILLMENAGRNIAEWIFGCYRQHVRYVHIFCGAGNNGGDGFCIARHLFNHGMVVRVILAGSPDKLSEDAAVNHRIAKASGIEVTVAEDPADFENLFADIGAEDLIVDALLGTGFQGEVREPMAQLIKRINEATVTALIAVDVPSGLDCEKGEVGNVAINADTTITLVARKRGFDVPTARAHLGAVIVRDIGTPPSLVQYAVSEPGA